MENTGHPIMTNDNLDLNQYKTPSENIQVYLKASGHILRYIYEGDVEYDFTEKGLLQKFREEGVEMLGKTKPEMVPIFYEASDQRLLRYIYGADTEFKKGLNGLLKGIEIKME